MFSECESSFQVDKSTLTVSENGLLSWYWLYKKPPADNLGAKFKAQGQCHPVPALSTKMSSLLVRLLKIFDVHNVTNT